MSIKENTLSLTDHNMVFGTNRKTPCSAAHLSTAQLSQAKGLPLCASHSETPTEHILCGMIYKKIKSIGKRYGHYGHPSAIVHYLLPIIAIQGPWGRLQWTGNILNMAILETPSYGQTMATMAGSMASRLSANRIYSIWYDLHEKKTQVKNKWDKWDKRDSGVSYPQSPAFYRNTRLLSQAGVDRQYLDLSHFYPKQVGQQAGQVGQLNDC